MTMISLMFCCAILVIKNTLNPPMPAKVRVEKKQYKKHVRGRPLF